MSTSMFYQFLAREGIVIAWVIILLVALIVLFRYGIRKIDSRATVLWMGGLILILSLGQFLFFCFYYAPAVKRDLRAEIDTVTDKMAVLDIDNVNQNDLVVAYKRENEIMNHLIRKLRTRNTRLEERVEDLIRWNGQIEQNKGEFGEEK